MTLPMLQKWVAEALDQSNSRTPYRLRIFEKDEGEA